MKRLLPFTIVFTTAVAALLVMIVQPRETSLQKKRLKDMRQFLLALITDYPLNCDVYMQEHPEYYSACVGWWQNNAFDNSSSSLPNEDGGSQSALTPAEELECSASLRTSLFGPVWQQYGLPNAPPTNMQLKVREICENLKNATGERGGVNNITLNAAQIKIKDIVYAFLRATPGPDPQQPFIFNGYIEKIVYPYINQGYSIIKKFTDLTRTNPYLVSIADIPPYYSPYIKKLEKDLANLISKPETPSAEKTSAPQENKIRETVEPVTITAAAESTPPQQGVVRTINKFIKTLKESFLNIRKRNPKPRVVIPSSEYAQETKKLIRYFHNLRKK